MSIAVAPWRASDLGQILARAAHADAVDPQPLLARVVIEQRDRLVAAVTVVQHRSQDLPRHPLPHRRPPPV